MVGLLRPSPLAADSTPRALSFRRPQRVCGGAWGAGLPALDRPRLRPDSPFPGPVSGSERGKAPAGPRDAGTRGPSLTSLGSQSQTSKVGFRRASMVSGESRYLGYVGTSRRGVNLLLLSTKLYLQGQLVLRGNSRD